MRLIQSTDITLGMVPLPDADWAVISSFALSFDGYEEWGSSAACAEIANARRDSTLKELRTCLFFEQRRWRHFGESPDEETMTYIRGIITKIRDKVAANALD